MDNIRVNVSGVSIGHVAVYSFEALLRNSLIKDFHLLWLSARSYFDKSSRLEVTRFSEASLRRFTTFLANERKTC